MSTDPFDAYARLEAGGRHVRYVRLAALRDRLATPLERLPVTVKILLENVLRHCGTAPFTERDVLTLAAWAPGQSDGGEVPFLPARVLLQDFTGVPAVVDLAAMRDAMQQLGGATSLLIFHRNLYSVEVLFK